MNINKISPVRYYQNNNFSLKNQNQVNNSNEIKAPSVFHAPFVSFCASKQIKDIIMDAKKTRGMAVIEKRIAKEMYNNALMKFSNGLGQNFRNVYDSEGKVVRSFERNELGNIVVSDYDKNGIIISEAYFSDDDYSIEWISTKIEPKKSYMYEEAKPFCVSFDDGYDDSISYYHSEYEFEYDDNYIRVNKDARKKHMEEEFWADEVYLYIGDKMYYFEDFENINNKINWARAFEIDSSDKVREIYLNDKIINVLLF